MYPKEKWGLAFYRSQLSKFKTDVDTEGPFVSTAVTPTGINVTRFRPMSASLELDVVAWGASGSVRVAPSFFVGAGVTFNQLDFTSMQQRFCTDCVGGANFPQAPCLGRH